MKMKKSIQRRVIVIALLITSLVLHLHVHAQSPVESWGQLRVQGADIINENGEKVQLQGMSLFWSQWEPDYYEYNTIKWLRDDWCSNVVRAACGVEDNVAQGIAGNPYLSMDYQLDKARAVTDAALALNIYALIDWHGHKNTYNVEAAKTFFRTMAQEYGNQPNIIYEIFNEPVGYKWSEIKEYAEVIIQEIRKYDPDNIIIVGTPEYAAYPDAVVGNEIKQSNIAYTLHYYAASHAQEYRNRANWARNNGLCVFVTEYGLVNYDGGGSVNEDSSREWWKWMNDNKISHCNWSLCDKDEGASALIPGTASGGFWNSNQLTWSGALVRENLKANCPIYEPRVPNVTRIPAKIEAEDYSKMLGVQRETTSDEGGGFNIGYTETNDYVEYYINATGAGEYTVEYRVAANESAKIQVLIDGQNEHVLSVNTGDWQNWETQTQTISLSAGEHTLRLIAITGGWNINYINFLADGIVDCNGDIDGLAAIDNCDVCSGGNTGLPVNVCEGGCNSGYSAEGIKDDFSLSSDPYSSEGGVYAWGEEELEGDDNPNFRALLARDAQKQVLEIDVTQGEGEFVPFGFSFGEDQIKTIDLSNDASFELIFQNPSSVDVNVALALQDINGNLINTYAEAQGEDFEDAWKYGISASVNKGAIYSFKGDFSGGYHANYKSKTYESTFDFTQVATLLITVTNQKNDGAPTFAPLALDQVTLLLDDLRLGNCALAMNDNNKDCNGDINGFAEIDNCDVCAGGNTGVEANQCVTSALPTITKHAIEISPNPSKGLYHLSELINWTIYNMQGNLVLKGYGNVIDLSDEKNGMYVLKTTNEFTRIVKN